MICFGKRPLKWWNPLGGMKKSSLTFFNQVGVEIGTLGNEKDKEEENLEGSMWGITRVNMMDLVDKVVWLGLILIVRIYGLKREGGELFKRDFRKLWRYNENQCWITEKEIKETKNQNCFKMISGKQSVVSSKQSVVFISSL